MCEMLLGFKATNQETRDQDTKDEERKEKLLKEKRQKEKTKQEMTKPEENKPEETKPEEKKLEEIKKLVSPLSPVVPIKKSPKPKPRKILGNDFLGLNESEQVEE